MLAFIIFGTRGIRSTIKQGAFYCPQCQSEKNYKHKKVTQFFTLYFIPLIPLGNKGEYVECQTCRNTYIERVLDIAPVLDITPKKAVASSTTEEQIERFGGQSAQMGIASESAAQTSTPAASQSTPAASSDTSLIDQVKQLAEAEAALVAAQEKVAAEKAEAEKPVDILSEKQKAIKKVLIMMILADGKVEDSEISMFHKVYRDVADSVVPDIYKEIEEVRVENKAPRQYLKQVSAYLNEEGKKDIIKAAMMIAASDGDIDPSEVRMVENFGKALELRTLEVREIIESIKV
ncbi:MAG: hypothetical protein BM555_01065 [Crocinitomix sp. MedPE-SWsnd]|nr:MAG: hypothetical protein BM555_01065 [Crocinitomix sp. MedPE-SWsnd]